MAGLAVNELTTYRWSFEEDVAGYKAAGFEAIGVWRQKLADFGERRGIELIREAGLHVSSVLWAGGFTGSDGHSYQESIDDALDAIRLTAALDADCLVIYSGGRNGHTERHAQRLFAGALRDLLPAAEAHRVSMAVEPMHAGCACDWTILTSLDEAMALVDGIGHPNLKLVFDTYHLGHEPGIVDRVAALAPHIGVVHLGDSCGTPHREQNRCCLGEGQLPWAEIIRQLLDAGYSGCFDVELMGESVEHRDYREILHKSKCAFQRATA